LAAQATADVVRQQLPQLPQFSQSAPITLDVGDPRPPETEPRQLWAQELVRAGLAVAFFLLLAVTVIWALVLVGGIGWTNAKEALQILLPAETGLLGSAAGFYFGSRRT
jgi:hypothetical protein